MRKLIVCISWLVLGAPLFAQPAIYQDGVLTIPQAAIIDSDGLAFFTNLKLQSGDDGSLTLQSVQESNLAQVNSVEVIILESFPLQINLLITGTKSVPCVDLEEPAVSRVDELFVVVLAETTLGPAESCIAIIDPFETSLSLDVAGLKAGTYKVRVNGVNVEFTLSIDN